jgi:hypothetical protein
MSVRVKKNLVRAHAVVTKDCSENVVFWVEAIGSTEGVDRKGSGRKSATRAADVAGGVRGGDELDS